ncbi:MAG: hypothetical protein ACOCV3_00190, partial [Halanaerobiales bacterium]
MVAVISDLFIRLKQKFRPYLEEKEIIPEEEPTLEDEINEAHQQWLDARQYFNNVSDPELIDYASYKIEAARIATESGITMVIA